MEYRLKSKLVYMWFTAPKKINIYMLKNVIRKIIASFHLLRSNNQNKPKKEMYSGIEMNFLQYENPIRIFSIKEYWLLA